LKVLRGAALVAALLIALAPQGRAQKLDGIAAVVNDDVVLESDVEEQLFLFLQRAGARPDSSALDTLRAQILNQLIDEKLIVAEAKRQGIAVTDAEVAKEVEDAVADARQRLGGDEAFAAQLARENTTLERLREKYRAEIQRQMIAQRLVQKQLPRRPVPATEAEAFFKANPSRFPRVPGEVRLQVIQIPVAPDSARDAAARAEIVAIRKRIVAGEKFAKLAADLSQDPSSAKAGGDLGFFPRGAMEPAFERAAFGQPVGVLGEPVRSAFGWHLIEVLERDTLRTRAGRDSLGPDGAPLLEAHARHILIRVPVEEPDVQRAETLARRVREEAAKGTDFGTLVRRYSKYDGPADEQGDVGFVSLGTLSPGIRAGLDSLEIGQVSEVLPNQVGFNVFKVRDRKPEREYTLEEIRDELPEAVGQLKFRDRYDEWVKGLRAKAHIEIRRS
jgi:peptidyl-prolyl cis-trans isomerase SurA